MSGVRFGYRLSRRVSCAPRGGTLFPEFTSSRVDSTPGNPYGWAVGTAAAPKHHLGVVHRFRCARIGHYWATDGYGTRGVCLRCGRHRDVVTSLSVRPPETPSSDAGVSRPAVRTPDPVAAFDERPHHRVLPPLAEHPAGAALGAEPNSPMASSAASDIASTEPASSAEEPLISAARSERDALSTLAVVSVAAVSLAVLGGVAYLALSHRKRRARWL